MSFGRATGQLPDTAGILYQIPVDGRTIKNVVLYNSNTSTELVKLYFVDNVQGQVGTASAANQVLELSLGAKSTFEFYLENQVELGRNDAVFGESTTADVVNFWVDGSI